MKHPDQLLRFSFERLDIRGELVYLDESWSQVLQRHDYPPNVRKQLGEALAVVALLRATIKFDGTLILQIQGKGPLRSLVTQITSKGALRGLARWHGTVPPGPVSAVFGSGSLIITVMKDGGERYQSIVELAGDTLSAALDRYFAQSEQLPTSFRLQVSAERVAGFLLQALPPAAGSLYGDEARAEDWRRINLLADTLQADELLQDEPLRLLHKLFHEEEVQLFDPVPLHFECTCSREKVEKTLITFGEPDLEDIIRQEGSVKVDCEFCNQHYRFDRSDVARLFRPDATPPAGTILH
ncbi:MAG: Hsp33 family molecular chaperone HslO [Pseudohongiellaceae bacterium]